MSRSGLNASLATEIATSLVENGSGGEPSYTYDEDTRRVIFQVYSYLLNLAAKKQASDSHNAPESAEEVQDDRS